MNSENIPSLTEEYPRILRQSSQDSFLEKGSLIHSLQRQPSKQVEKNSNERNQTISKCLICETEMQPKTGFQHPRCCHPFCRGCYSQYITESMNEFKMFNITCPQQGCPYFLTDNFIKLILSDENWKIFETKKLIKMKLQDTKLKYCPKSGCAIEFHPDPSKQATICECGTSICNQCSYEEHPGRQCEEVVSRSLEFYYIELPNIRVCIVCKTACERKKGCAHVKCPACDYEWCWECGQEWTFGHAKKCSHHWDPKPPEAMRTKTWKDHFLLPFICLIWLIESIFFFLRMTCNVVLLWPWYVLALPEKKLPVKKCVWALKFIGAFLLWPIAIIAAPFSVWVEEYMMCCRRRRWQNRDPAKFGIREFEKSKMTLPELNFVRTGSTFEKTIDPPSKDIEIMIKEKEQIPNT